MASTWGSNTWSSNSFGSDNNIISVTGIGATFSLGDESSQANADVIPTSLPITANQGNENIVISTTGNPTGIGATFSLGTADAGPDAMVTGLDTVTASVGTLDAFNIEGWGRRTWNSFAWGITGTLEVSGESATANLGSIADVIGTANVDLTGIQLTADLGTALEIIAVEVPITGINLTSNLGTADAGPDAMVTGLDTVTASVGSVEAYNLEGWGRYFWGQFEWGATGEWESVDVTGIEMSAATNPEGIPSFTAEADAQLSTAQAKFGPSSLLLDGTGDFVQSTATDVVQNNFTIEFFAYASNFAQDAYLWDNQSSNQGFAISITSAGQLRLIQDGTILQQTGTPSLNNNQWNHFALEQNSTLLTLYINGTPKLQYSTGGDSYPGQSYKIGANEAETQFFNGYIDEFRSSDIARYTGLFTPPTSPFTVDGNTISLLHFDGANGSTQIFNETQNAYSITGTADIDVTGEAMTAAEGIVDPAPDADVTGIGFNASLAVGTVVIGEANVTVVGEGFAAGLGVGNLDAVTLVDLTGISMSANIGTVTAKGFANVSLTGFGLTMAEGTNRTLVWNQVNTGTAPTWTEVDTAA